MDYNWTGTGDAAAVDFLRDANVMQLIQEMTSLLIGSYDLYLSCDLSRDVYWRYQSVVKEFGGKITYATMKLCMETFLPMRKIA